MLLLFLLMSKGGERLFVLSLCCRTHFGYHKKKGDCWKGELVQLKWRWFWWCLRLGIMCITILGLVLIFYLLH